MLAITMRRKRLEAKLVAGSDRGEANKRINTRGNISSRTRIQRI